MIPTVNGMNASPAWVGVMPLAICRYSGKPASAPNIPKPMITLITAVTENNRFWNRRSGRRASSPAWCSATTKAAIPKAPRV